MHLWDAIAKAMSMKRREITDVKHLPDDNVYHVTTHDGVVTEVPAERLPATVAPLPAPVVDEATEATPTTTEEPPTEEPPAPPADETPAATARPGKR